MVFWEEMFHYAQEFVVSRVEVFLDPLFKVLFFFWWVKYDDELALETNVNVYVVLALGKADRNTWLRETEWI
jgi:hypothetical protein